MKRKRASKAIVHQAGAQSYAQFLTGIKGRIRTAQIKAAISANRELILLYWDIGRAIVYAQKSKGYGKRVVEMLSADLQREFPKMAGLSALNLWRMRAFYLAYAVSDKKLSQAVTESNAAPQRRLKQPVSETSVQPAEERHGQKLSQAATESVGAAIDLVASLPWGHNIVLMQKIKEVDARLWYARAALEHSWSRSVLIHQVDTKLHKRIGKAPSNFAFTLPPPQSDLAREILKDPYIFKPALLDESATERVLEQALLERLKDFLLELGAGFAFVGNQYRIEVDGDEFFLDLLFYHTRLHCYVVVDLKVVDFQPEFAGKMSFYQAAVDRQVKTPEDGGTIGIILCRGKNQTVVEYTLRDAKSPIGVAEYRLLPPKLKAELPETRQLKKLVAEIERPQ